MEYARAGDGWVRRPDAQYRWKDVAESDVPAEVTGGLAGLEIRKRSLQELGYDAVEREEAREMAEPKAVPDAEDWNEEDHV